MVILEFDLYGEHKKVKLVKSSYDYNNALYIGAYNVVNDDDEIDDEKFYGDVTVNTYACDGSFVTLNNNNGPVITEEILKHKEWYEGDPIDVPQGFCRLPAVNFKKEFIDMLDELEK